MQKLKTFCVFFSIYISKSLWNKSTIFTFKGFKTLSNKKKLNHRNVIKIINRFQNVLENILVKSHHNEKEMIKKYENLKKLGISSF